MNVSDIVAPLTLRSIFDKELKIPAQGGQLTHLQFRRYAGCPICHLHLHSFKARYSELAKAGIFEVAVFHSPKEEMLEFKADFPFDLIADPAKQLYKQFGVGTSPLALLSAKVMLAVARGEMLMKKRTLAAPGGRLGVPADFLIDAKGKILACKYGRHADDQWSVDELLALTKNSLASVA